MRVIESRRKRPLNLITLSSTGHVAAGSSTFGVRPDVDVWNVATGAHCCTHSGFEQSISGLSFHPDGNRLVVGATDWLTVLDIRTQRVATGLAAKLGFPQIAFSTDGSRMLVTESLNAHSSIDCFACDSEPTFRKQWSVPPRQYILFGDPAIAPDGSRMAVSVHEGFSNHPRNIVQLREPEKGKVQTTIDFDPDGSNPVEQIAFSADSSLVLVRSSGRTVKLFDAATGQPAGELLHPGRPYVTGMAIHPAGMVACSRNDGTVCLWNLANRKLVKSLDWKLGKLVSVAFSPDGTIGVAGTEDGKLIVWDVDA